MTITQAPDGTWSFTHGTQHYGSYPTREAAAEAQYDLERSQAPQGADDLLRAAAHWLDTHLPPAAVAAAHREMADPAHRWGREPVEVGRTARGLPIMGLFDVDGAPFVVEIETGYWNLSADEDGDLSLSCNEDGSMIELAAHADGIAILRDLPTLIAGDTPERLLELARRWYALRPPDPPKKTARVAEAPQSTPAVSAPTYKESFAYRTGYAAATLTLLMDRLDRARGEQLLKCIEQLWTLGGDALAVAVDRLITTRLA